MFTPERIDAVSKSVLALLAIALLTVKRESWSRHRASMLLALAVVSAVIFPMRGDSARTTHIHRWDQFHYVIGAKYFPELGYDGLYEASYAVLARTDPNGAPKHIRDLRTGLVVASSEIRERAFATLDRMEPRRRAEFERDVRFFLDGLTGYNVVRLFLDHGYNGTPTFTAVARLATQVGPISEEGLLRFASLDLGLALLMVAALAATFGRSGVALPVLVATTSIGWHFGWTGGAFLRLDWIAAVVFGIVALARSRLVLGAVLLAYASAARVFPTVFAFAAVLPWIADLSRPESRRDLARFAGAYVAALAGFAAIGCTGGHGLAAYPEFAARIAAHRRTWMLNDVGFGIAIVVDRIELLRHLIDPRLADPPEPWAIAVGAARAARAPFAWITTALVASYLAKHLRRRPSHEAAVFGVMLLFFATSPANYYWVICLLVPIAAPPAVVSTLLAISLVLSGLTFAMPNSMSTASLALSFSLLVVFGHWLYVIRNGEDAPPAIRGAT